MKTIIFIISVILFSCEPNIITHKEATRNPSGYKIDSREFKVYTIDSCEYIGGGMNYNGAVLTHKGNCNFCQTRNKLK